ncbi:MAG TPA: hypothetical protein VGD57_10315 [Candidatus Dormibacteraeota bacterium]|jgi:hypothetical protein
MALSISELAGIAGDPRNPWGELRMIWTLRQRELLPSGPLVPAPATGQILAHAA